MTSLSLSALGHALLSHALTLRIMALGSQISRAARDTTRFLICLGLMITLTHGIGAMPAWAVTQLRLSELGTEPCPAEIGAGSVVSGSVSPANCYLIKGKVENTSGRDVVDADVFGRVFDANNNPIMQNRGRLGSIDTVPPGVSDFAIRISVASNQPAPFTLEKFKASGFSSRVRQITVPDPDETADDELDAL
jgi:hypothetical protein